MTSYSGYYISPQVAPARVGISVFPVLTLLFLRNGIYAGLPRISYRIWLGDLLFVSLLFCAISVIHFGVLSELLEDEKSRTNKFKLMLASLARKKYKDQLSKVLDREHTRR